MTWSVVRNDEPRIYNIEYSGTCDRFGDNATIKIYYSGGKTCKTDLHNTYHESGFKCSLLESTDEASFAVCRMDCQLIPKELRNTI